MGDVSAEPSMEDILSSIKRIIAEEGEERSVRPRRSMAARALPTDEPHGDTEILELGEPLPAVASQTADKPEAALAQPAVIPPSAPEPAPAPPAADTAEAAAILSDRTAQTTRNALDALSRMMIRPEPQSDGTLEGLVREMLRPMLRDWLDANLPSMVETLVAREIAKLTKGA